MEQKNKRIENIEIKYADKIVPDKTKEQALINNANEWFNPFIEEFNREGVIIEFFVDSDFKNHISFENISEDLKQRALTYFDIFKGRVI